jgi:type IV secretory pathway VirB10-like protein
MTPSLAPVRTRRRHPRGAGVRWVVIGFAAFALLLSACSDDSKSQISEAVGSQDTGSGSETGDGSQPPATDAPETEPPATDPPATDPPPETEAPPATEPPATDSEEPSTDDGMSTEDWILLGILGLGALVLIVGVTSVAHNHSEKKAAALADQNRSIGEIVGSSRWIHDQGSLEVLRLTDPDQLSRSWDDVRGRMVDLEAAIATKRAATDDANLERSLGDLGQSVAGLRGALSSYVSLRTGPDAGSQTELIQDASQTARERRQQLAAAIEPVAAARR